MGWYVAHSLVAIMYTLCIAFSKGLTYRSRTITEYNSWIKQDWLVSTKIYGLTIVFKVHPTAEYNIDMWSARILDNSCDILAYGIFYRTLHIDIA